MKNKIFKSIDGLFESNLNYSKIKNLYDISNRRLLIIGKGNSISLLPYKKGSMLIDLSLEDNICQPDIKGVA